MKNLRVILSCLTIFFVSHQLSFGQASLKVTALLNFPDSAVDGQLYTVNAIVKNSGTGPYFGTISIGLKTDSLQGNFVFLLQGTQPVLLQPLDSVLLTTSTPFQFNNTLFRTGNNVVVVWPYSTQSVIIDSTYLNVYYTSLQGIAEQEVIRDIPLYPVPATDFILLPLNDEAIESVRIYSVTGTLCFNSRLRSNRIPVSQLSPGLYLIRFTDRKGLYYSGRFVKN